MSNRRYLSQEGQHSYKNSRSLLPSARPDSMRVTHLTNTTYANDPNPFSNAYANTRHGQLHLSRPPPPTFNQYSFSSPAAPPGPVQMPHAPVSTAPYCYPPNCHGLKKAHTVQIPTQGYEHEPSPLRRSQTERGYTYADYYNRIMAPNIQSSDKAQGPKEVVILKIDAYDRIEGGKHKEDIRRVEESYEFMEVTEQNEQFRNNLKEHYSELGMEEKKVDASQRDTWIWKYFFQSSDTKEVVFDWKNLCTANVMNRIDYNAWEQKILSKQRKVEETEALKNQKAIPWYDSLYIDADYIDGTDDITVEEKIDGD